MPSGLCSLSRARRPVLRRLVDLTNEFVQTSAHLPQHFTVYTVTPICPRLQDERGPRPQRQQRRRVQTLRNNTAPERQLAPSTAPQGTAQALLLSSLTSDSEV